MYIYLCIPTTRNRTHAPALKENPFRWMAGGGEEEVASHSTGATLSRRRRRWGSL